MPNFTQDERVRQALRLPQSSFELVKSWLGTNAQANGCPVFINVKLPPYNALGAGTDVDDGPAIQAAITAAAASMTGAVVYFPAGVYEIMTPIVIPRGVYKSLTLLGDGPGASKLHSSGDRLAPQYPVISVADTLGVAGVHFFNMYNLRIGRTGVGNAFKFDYPTAGSDSERWRGGEVRNCHFQSSGASGTYATFHARGLQNVFFDNICSLGGYWGFFIEGSQINTNGLYTDQDNANVNGFKLRIGNGQMTGMHVQSCNGGIGVDLTGCKNVTLHGVIFEGKKTSTQILVGEGAFNVTIRDMALGGGTDANRIGVDIHGTAMNIHIDRGICQDNFFNYTNGKAIRIQAGARYIYGNDLMMHPNDVQPEGLWTGKFRVYTGSGVPSEMHEIADTSVLTLLTLSTGTPTVKDCGELAYVNFTVPETITTMIGGIRNRCLRLVAKNNNCTFATGGNIVLARGAALAMRTGDVLHLLHDGTDWREVSRELAGAAVTQTATGFAAGGQCFFSVAFAGAGNLDSITGGYAGQEITLVFANSNCTVRHLSGGGNIKLSGAQSLSAGPSTVVRLKYDGTNWLEVSRSTNA